TRHADRARGGVPPRRRPGAPNHRARTGGRRGGRARRDGRRHRRAPGGRGRDDDPRRAPAPRPKRNPGRGRPRRRPHAIRRPPADQRRGVGSPGRRARRDREGDELAAGRRRRAARPGRARRKPGSPAARAGRARQHFQDNGHPRKERAMKRLMTLALVVCLAATASACGGNKSSKSGGKTAVTISNEQGTTWSCGFNPFNSDVNFLSFGTVYEELTFVNGLKSGQTTDWLASSYAWSNSNKTLTVTIRPGVKWSDGKPLTAADVLFTFNLIKKFPGIDLNAAWSVLKDVKQSGDKITFDFKTAAVPYFYYIADQTPIVPQHIWASIKNPVTYKDAHPIGSGPFTMNSCSPQVTKYTKNPNYWQKGLPKIETVYYPAFTSNDPANQQLASGKAQWGSQFIPNINKYYLSKNANNHYWFPPLVNVSIFINLKDPILSNVAVRKAMAYAIDREKVSKIGEYGYEPASNQTGIVTPTFNDWLDPTLAKQVNYNPKKAISTLEAAGYKRSCGIFQTPDGKPLSFTIINIGRYS